MGTAHSEEPFPAVFPLAHPRLSFKSQLSVAFSTKPLQSHPPRRDGGSLADAQVVVPACVYSSTYHTVVKGPPPTRSLFLLKKVPRLFIFVPPALSGC